MRYGSNSMIAAALQQSLSLYPSRLQLCSLQHRRRCGVRSEMHRPPVHLKDEDANVIQILADRQHRKCYHMSVQRMLVGEISDFATR